MCTLLSSSSLNMVLFPQEEDGGQSKHLRVESKNFYFDVKNNERGSYLTISEVRGGLCSCSRFVMLMLNAHCSCERSQYAHAPGEGRQQELHPGAQVRMGESAGRPGPADQAGGGRLRELLIRKTVF